MTNLANKKPILTKNNKKKTSRNNKHVTTKRVLYIPEFLRHQYEENGARILGKSMDYP